MKILIKYENESNDNNVVANMSIAELIAALLSAFILEYWEREW